MAAYAKDKVIKSLAGETVDRIKKWRKAFNAPLTREDASRLAHISEHIDGLWERAVEDRRRAGDAACFAIPLFGRDRPLVAPQRLDQERSYLLRSTGPYRRLQLVMDAWCALWFWPISEASTLPKRDEWLRTIELLAAGQRDSERG